MGEPRLKYSVLEHSLSPIQALTVTERFLAVITSPQDLNVTDLFGHPINHFPHTSPIADLSLSSNNDFIATATQRGSVWISSLYLDTDVLTLELGAGLSGIALSPEYGTKSRQFVIGDEAGRVILHSRSWYRNSTNILHQGSGVISRLEWREDLVSWVNLKDVHVHDSATGLKVGVVSMESDCTALTWSGPLDFFVGAGSTIKVVGIRLKSDNVKHLEVFREFNMECVVCGIAPLHDSLLILGLHLEDIKLLITDLDGTLSCEDILSISRYSPLEYHLESDKQSVDPTFYIVSPNDLLIVKQRDVKDHADYLVEHGEYLEAILVLKRMEVDNKKEVKEVAKLLIAQYVESKEFHKAAEWIERVVVEEQEWEEYVSEFRALKQLGCICNFLPLSFSISLYDSIILDYLKGDLDGLLKLVERWPRDLYDSQVVIEAVQKMDRNNTVNQILYKDDKEKAIYYGLLLRIPNQAIIIEENNLFHFLHENVQEALEYALDTTSSIKECVESKMVRLIVNDVPVDTAVKQLEKLPKLKHIFLDALFKKEGHEGHEFHNQQVGLYIQFDSSSLLEFLRASTHYNHTEAYQLCEKADMIPEMMYLLGKSGDNLKALYLIIERLQDVNMAIEFTKEQNEEELWAEFLKFAMDKPKFIVALLTNLSGFIDPLRVVEKIPLNLEIPGLNEAVEHMMRDCKTQLSLRLGCEKILQSDIWETFSTQYNIRTKAQRLSATSVCSSCKDILSDDNIVIFFCDHHFHAECISANIVCEEVEVSQKKYEILLDQAINSIYSRQPLAPSQVRREETYLDVESLTCPLCTVK